ncbi:MAG: DUF5615 family PIN-like protein [bacterium]
MTLNFIADVHISPLTIFQLKKFGFRINRITEFLPATASDDQIIELAQREKAVIISQDLDFSALIAQSGLQKPSIIS